jgi:enamine deaminase RidA (YjgF/YER057c/UK114 family)
VAALVFNPWRWQDQFGFSQAWRVDGAKSIVFLAGQAPISPEGQLVGEGDFEAQTRQVFENLSAVLEQSGASFESIVKLTVYVTDTAKLVDYAPLPAMARAWRSSNSRRPRFTPGSMPTTAAAYRGRLPLA